MAAASRARSRLEFVSRAFIEAPLATTRRHRESGPPLLPEKRPVAFARRYFAASTFTPRIVAVLPQYWLSTTIVQVPSDGSVSCAA